MERLTKIDKYGHYYTNEKVNDRMQLDEPQPHAYDGKVIDKLAHYEDLAEKGLLVELPCKIGDTVYDLQKMRNRIQPLVITSIHIEKNGIFYNWELVGVGMYHNVAGFEESQIGKTVFLTKSEAEQALADMN